jgi:hypothetical protein
VSRVFSSRVQNILIWTECQAKPVVINMPGKFAKDLAKTDASRLVVTTALRATYRMHTFSKRGQ